MSSLLLQPLALPAGLAMPLVGFGCWKLGKENGANIVEQALKLGYRHIDSACDYGNEVQVGEGIRNAIDKGICKREEIFVTSKLWNTYHAPQHVLAACKKTLSDLGLDYLDLYLIHFPISLKFVPFETRYPPEWFHDPNAEDKKMIVDPVPISETWKAMEHLVESGLVKNIGISNWNCQGIRDLLSHAKIKPAVLQVELHPYLQQRKLVRYAQSEGIVVTGFSPLGNGKSYWNESVSTLKEKIIEDIANKKNVTPAQVVLRWGIQRGYSVIPKSENLERLGKNLDLFSFDLNEEEINSINNLERNQRFNDPGVFCEGAFNTFCPIFD